MRGTELSGSVTAKSGGVGGLLVEAWGVVGSRLDEPLASAVVSGDGAFHLSLAEGALADRRVCFRFFSGPELVATLEQDLDGRDTVALELSVAPAVAPPAGPVHAVRGRIRSADGAPVVAARVRAYAKELRKEHLLGEATTDAAGRYEVRYQRSADVVIRVYRGDQPVAEAPIRFNAPASARIDVDLPPGVRPGRSAFEQIEAACKPLVAGDAAPLGPDELRFLAGKTGLPEDELRDFDRAGRLAAAAGIPPAAAFALLRYGLPHGLTDLLSATRADHEAALATAVAQGLVPAALEAETSAVAQRLAKLRTLYPMRKAAGDELTFGALMTAGGIPRPVQETFLRLVAAHSGPAAHLWRKLKNHPDGGTQATNDLAFAVQAAALARGVPGLVDHLHDLRARGHAPSLRDLAGLDPADWRARLDEARIEPPAGTPGADEGERKDSYARWLSATLEAGFPTAALAQRMARDPATEKRPAVKYLVDHPDFDLGHDTPRTYVGGNPALIGELERLQRLYRLAPRHAELRALEKAGFDSAFAVATAGRERFLRAVGGALEPAVAGRIFAAANRVALASFALLADHSPTLSAPSLAAVPPPPTGEIAGLGELLAARAPVGPGIEADSALGPGAYLADLLAFLGERRLAGGRSALDVLLLDRRADLATLPLGGAAAHSRVPRIDLVIELLERAVAGDTDPMHAAESAATSLAAATFPLALPFDRARAQARIFLDHLGVPRHEIMTAYQRRDRTAPTDMEIAAEELGLLPAEVELVTAGFRAAAPVRVATRAAVTLRGLPVVDGVALVAGDRVLVKHQPNVEDDGVYVTHPRGWIKAADATHGVGLVVEVEEGVSRGPWVLGTEGWGRMRAAGEIDALHRQPWEYWGFADDGTITDATWPAVITDVLTLCARTGMTRQELAELLAVPWVNPDGAVAIEGDRLAQLDAAAARRILRFARLRRRLGWSAADLGRAVAVLAPREITDRSLATLAELGRLAAETRLALADLLPLYGVLDRPSYERLAGDSELLALAGDEPKATGKPMSQHAAAVGAAVGLSASDLLFLVDPAAAQTLGLDDAPVPDEISIANVSRVYRRVILARAAGLTIAELLVLLALAGKSPFDGDRIDETRRFLELAAKVKGTGFTVAELETLLRGDAAPDPTIAATLEAVKAGVAGALTEEAAEAAVVGPLTELLGLERPVVHLLAGEAIHHPRRALDALREGDAEAVGQLKKLKRAAILVRRLRLGADLPWVVRHGPELGWLDLDGLPEGRSTIEDAAIRFTAWERLVDYLALRDALFGGEPVLTGLLQAALDAPPDGARAAYLALLAQRTGWPATDLDALATGMGLTFPKDFRDVRTLTRLAKAFALVRRTGVGAARLLAWRGSMTLTEANDVAAAVRTRIDDASAQPLTAAVRAARRDALVAYLLHARDAHGAKALSDHFLVDVQTADTVLTSRLEQAIASTRLFVQRCFLGLETEVTFGPEDARRWRWLSDLRGWQEQRRMVLYPEDHLSGPADPSPSFAALGAEVAEGRIDDAIRGFLERLDETARLEIVGLHDDEGAGVLHLVGRTAGAPHRHYYRTRAAGAWGPWEPVAAEIDGEPVLPVAFDGRVAILWPVRSGGELRLGWTERKRDGWAERRVGTDALRVPPGVLHFRSAFGAAGEPVVTVLADPTPDGPPRPPGPTVGEAPARRVLVAGRFRLTARGPLAVDATGEEEILAAPLRCAGQLRLTRDDGSDLLVLRKAPARHRVTLPHQAGAQSPIVFDDGERTYLATVVGAHEIPWNEPTRMTPGMVDAAMREPWPGGPVTLRRAGDDAKQSPSEGGVAAPAAERLFPEPAQGRWRFERLDHARASELLRRLGKDGVHAVFASGADAGPGFEASYDPVPGLVEAARGGDDPADRELHIHAPILVAARLMAQRRFADAQRWLHHVFDPSDPDKPVWKRLARGGRHIDEWLCAPFDPQRIARARTAAAPRAVVRMYVDNLLAWGDQLLGEGAAEAAALLYRLAAKVLGPRPRAEATGPASGPPTFEDLRASGQNLLVALESYVAYDPDARAGQIGDGIEAVLALGRLLGRFRVPAHEGLAQIWDAVAERLERVR